MAKKGNRMAARKSQPSQLEILETLTAADALAVVRHLARQDAEMIDRITKAAMEILSNVDVDRIAAEVQAELEGINVDEVFHRAGATSHGYLDPGDAAWEVFEDVLRPFEEEVKKYRQLSMNREANHFCMGILKGLYDFDKESTSEYKEWAADVPGESFSSILQDWQKWPPERKDVAEMGEFLERNCPDWASSFRKQRE